MYDVYGDLLGMGRKLRTTIWAFRMRCPLVAAVAAITYVIIDPRRPHPHVQATSREMSFLVLAIESPHRARIGTWLVTAIRLAVTIVVIKMVERHLFTSVQTLKVPLKVGLIGVVVEQANATKQRRAKKNVSFTIWLSRIDIVTPYYLNCVLFLRRGHSDSKSPAAANSTVADKVIHVALFAAQRLHHLLVFASNLLYAGQLIQREGLLYVNL